MLTPAQYFQNNATTGFSFFDEQMKELSLLLQKESLEKNDVHKLQGILLRIFNELTAAFFMGQHRTFEIKNLSELLVSLLEHKDCTSNKVFQKIILLIIQNDYNVQSYHSEIWNIFKLALSKGLTEILKIIIEKFDEKTLNFDTEEHGTALYLASEKGNIEIVKALLARADLHVDVNKGKIIQDLQGIIEISPLFAALEKENVEIVKLLLAQKNIDVNKGKIIQNGEKIQIPPLFVAFDKMYKDIALLLLKKQFSASEHSLSSSSSSSSSSLSSSLSSSSTVLTDKEIEDVYDTLHSLYWITKQHIENIPRESEDLNRRINIFFCNIATSKNIEQVQNSIREFMSSVKQTYGSINWYNPETPQECLKQHCKELFRPGNPMEVNFIGDKNFKSIFDPALKIIRKTPNDITNREKLALNFYIFSYLASQKNPLEEKHNVLFQNIKQISNQQEADSLIDVLNTAITNLDSSLANKDANKQDLDALPELLQPLFCQGGLDQSSAPFLTAFINDINHFVLQIANTTFDGTSIAAYSNIVLRGNPTTYSANISLAENKTELCFYSNYNAGDILDAKLNNVPLKPGELGLTLKIKWNSTTKTLLPIMEQNGHGAILEISGEGFLKEMAELYCETGGDINKISDLLDIQKKVWDALSPATVDSTGQQQTTDSSSSSLSSSSSSSSSSSWCFATPKIKDAAGSFSFSVNPASTSSSLSSASSASTSSSSVEPPRPTRAPPPPPPPSDSSSSSSSSPASPAPAGPSSFSFGSSSSPSIFPTQRPSSAPPNGDINSNTEGHKLT